MFLIAAMAACLAAPAWSQTQLPPMPDLHPRLLVAAGSTSEAVRERVAHDAAAASGLAALKARVQPYVERHREDPAWIVSRLQMYWQSHATQVYIKNGFYAHATGHAPVPTVRFTGARDSVTDYLSPKLEDVKPYMGENDRLYLQKRGNPAQGWEWVEQAKTGTIIQSINQRIAELARDAAFLYWVTGDEAYAKFSFDIFDTYMRGMYYREMPVDLGGGHGQTIVGMQSFETIHEDVIGPLAEGYDFMHAYVARQAGEKRALYDGAFKKWAEVIIANGVPWNNWNLIEARFLLQIAAVLDSDRAYADQRGREYYVRAVVDGSGARQWSLKRLLDYGYDSKTAIWNESPAYSINVLGDYVECLEMLDRVFGIDLLPAMPMVQRAATALPQYLLPNGRTVGFGDTRYDFLRTAAIERLQAYLARHGRTGEASEQARLLAAIRGAGGSQGMRPGAGSLHALIGDEAALSSAAAPASIRDYQTPTFYAPNASWLIQRNGYTRDDAAEDALVISQAGSGGNHAHANGIAMELYAKGYSLAPESGRGSGYLQNDYFEYYSQFPSHNTVVVDGTSTYPPMKSNHPLSVQGVYPQPGTPAAAAFPWATFSDVSFTEPATDAEQRRVLGTVRLDDRNAYFVDIFRSRRRNGNDRHHDYIYHNLGQAMGFAGEGGQALAAGATTKLNFGEGDLVGYDYWRNKQSLKYARPLQARFDLKLPDRSLAMVAWLQGDARREFFSLQAPPSTAWSGATLPAGIDSMPLQTLVIRQAGEAWARPFAAVFEALRDGAPASVQSVEEVNVANGAGHATALRVTAAGGRKQTIIAGDGDAVSYAGAGARLVGRYGIVAEREGKLDYLFLGHGREVGGQGAAIHASAAGASAALWQTEGKWFYTGSVPARLQVPAGAWPGELALRSGGKLTRLRGRKAMVGALPVLVFDMPAVGAVQIR